MALDVMNGATGAINGVMPETKTPAAKPVKTEKEGE